MQHYIGLAALVVGCGILVLIVMIMVLSLVGMYVQEDPRAYRSSKPGPLIVPPPRAQFFCTRPISETSEEGNPVPRPPLIDTGKWPV